MSASGFFTPDASYSDCAVRNRSHINGTISVAIAFGVATSPDNQGCDAALNVGFAWIALLAHSILSFVNPTDQAAQTAAFFIALLAESAIFENPFAMSDSSAILYI